MGRVRPASSYCPVIHLQPMARQTTEDLKLADFVPDHKLITAGEMYAVIKHIMAKRRVEASQSEYDVMVCVRSVDAATEVFENIPIEGTATEYGYAVAVSLGTLRDDYYDDDGEYTSKGMIGDVCSDLYHLLETQNSSKLADIDRKEARDVLTQEMNTLARLTPQPPDGLGVATIKIDVPGASGRQYFVEMVIQEISGERFAILGNIHSNDSYRFPLLEERLEFEVRGDT